MHMRVHLCTCVQTWATLCAGVCTYVFICMLVCKHELLSVLVYAHACSFVHLCASIGTCDVEYLHVHVFLFVHFRTVLKFLSSLQTLKILDSRKSLSLAVERESSSQFSSSGNPCCPWVAAGMHCCLCPAGSPQESGSCLEGMAGESGHVIHRARIMVSVGKSSTCAS